MRPRKGPRGSWAAYYALIGSALLLVAGYAARLTLSLRDTQRREAVERAARELGALSGVWEASVLDRSAAWLADLAESTDPARRESLIRASAPGVDALYLWAPGLPSPALLHPRLAPPEPPTAETQALAAELEEAQQLLLEDRASAAWTLLSTGERPLFTPLADVRPSAPPVRLTVLRRLLAAQAIGEMGDHRRQTSLLERTASEISSLSAQPLLDALPFLKEPLQAELDLLSDDALGRLSGAMARAERRAAGLRELQSRLPALTAQAEDELGVVAPPSEGTPLTERPLTAADLAVDLGQGRDGYVWIYALTRGAPRGVAVQWSTDALLDELLQIVPTDPRQGEIVVIDAEGRVLRGSPGCTPGTPGDGRAIWARASIGRALPGLSLGLCALAEHPPPHSGTGQLLAQLAPIGVALLLGIAAILARAGADRRQRELYERQRDFITRVTHELKTPLAGIRLMAENLEIGAFRDAAQREMLASRIVGEVDRLGARIDEVLRVAQTDRVDGRAPVLVHALAEEMARTWTERFATQSATLDVDLRPCPPVLGDRELLRDAVNNLLDNALKYGREDRPLRCRIATRAEGRWVVVDVTDNGLGVPAGRRKAIFEPFVRVEGPDRGKAGGHGLGLAFVAETARAHGGTVECREGVDGGARFILKLRRA